MNLDIEKMVKEDKTLNDILNEVIKEFDKVQESIEKEKEYKKKLAEQKEKAKITKNNLINAYIEYLYAVVSPLTDKERERLKVELSNVNNSYFNSLMYSSLSLF